MLCAICLQWFTPTKKRLRLCSECHKKANRKPYKRKREPKIPRAEFN